MLKKAIAITGIALVGILLILIVVNVMTRPILPLSGEIAVPNYFTASTTTNTSVTLSSGTSTQVLAAASSRTFFVACQLPTSSTTIFLSLGSVALNNSGIPLNAPSSSVAAPAECFELNFTKMFTGNINAYAGTTTTLIISYSQ